MHELQTRKDNFSQTRIVDTGDAPALKDGEIRVTIDSFSFTANNITYAVMGDQLRYWQFFPPSAAHADEDLSGWGIIPVWGFANVSESKSDEIAVGERLFGYFPPATSLIIKPVKVSQAALFDGTAHRSDLSPSYNIYRRVNAEANYDPGMDKERMLLYPLLVTSFCLHDMLQDNDFFAAEQVMILSASSKTSIGLAYALAEDQSSPPVVGMTSARNKATVEKLGLYSDVLSYDEIEQLDASKATVIVDMSANGKLLAALHTMLGDNMRFTSNVGLTHWSEAQPGEGFIKERSKMFFAPGHIQARLKEWGPGVFETKSSSFINRTALSFREWLSMHDLSGLSGLSEVYGDVCAGKVPAEQGIIIKM